MDMRLIEALIISSILSLLIFRINYTSNLKISRAKYVKSENKTQYDYTFLFTDVVVAVLFALVGCYLSWNTITTIPDFKDYSTYIFPISILTGITFQQGLPVIIELVMDKVNTFRPKKQ